MNRPRRAAPTLRHLPFFEELARHEEGSTDARYATAGLLIMRLLDHWELAGSQMVAPESVSVRAVREAIMALPAGDAVRECLLGTVNTLQTLHEVDVHPVLPRLFAYAKLLERRGEHAMGADVYESITQRASEAFDGDLLIDAYLRFAFCRRIIGAFEVAEEAYAMAGRIAKRGGQTERVLRARSGLANVAIARGNLPKAETMYLEIAEESAAAGLLELRASSLHTLGSITYKRGFPAKALRMVREALSITNDPLERERVLQTMGALLIPLERFDAARDALKLVDAIALSEEVRSAARIGLVCVAGRSGDRKEFVDALARVEGRSMNVEDRANLFIESARGYQRFGEFEHANALLESARMFAEANGLNRSVFEVEAMATDLAAQIAHARAEAAADSEVETTFTEVEHDLRKLTAEFAL